MIGGEGFGKTTRADENHANRRFAVFGLPHRVQIVTIRWRPRFCSVISTVYRGPLKLPMHTGIGKSSVNEPLDVDSAIYHAASRQTGLRLDAELQDFPDSHSDSLG
jgi:hypothetical protein